MSRPARGTPEYEAKRARLSASSQLILAILEESILTDPVRTHGRRTLADGTIADFTALADSGLTVTFRSGADGVTEFIDFLFVDD